MKIEDWQHWINDIDRIEGLSKLEKEKAKESFKTVSKIFDLDIPTLANNRHPIVREITNTAPWTRKWFVHLAEALQAAQLQANWQENFEKLKKADQYSEALLELDVAYAFIQLGFKVEFYPKIKEINKIPDLKITNPETDEEFYIEATHLESSDQAKESWKTFDAITKRLFFKSAGLGKKYLHTMGRTHKALSEPNLKRILKRIDETLEKARKSGFEELVEEKVIELGVSTEEKKHLLKLWAEDRKIENAFSGSSYSVDEAHRIQQKIRKKQSQLPKNLLNILVIKDDAAYMLGKRDIPDIGRLEEYVYEHDHLAICIIFNSFISGSGDKIQVFGDHLRLEKSSDLMSREILILSNKFITDKTITPNSISKLKQAFIENRAFLI